VILHFALILGLSPLAAVPAAGPISFRDVTARTGITFCHTDGSTGKRYLVETVASGLATLDYDDDGWTDIFFASGGRLEGNRAGDRPTNALYRNLGGFRFLDVTRQAGLTSPVYSMGVAAGDYDNDGHQDLYLSNFGPNLLYRNRGDGTFEDVTGRAGVGRGNKLGAGVAFLDIDGDGQLDLFAADYVKFSLKDHPVHHYMGVPIYPGPLDFSPEPADLFRNKGDGTFADVSRESGIAAVAGTGMGVVCADYDADGSTDIFVANDGMPNYLWHNDGTGKFQEMGLASGVGYDSAGVPRGSMGVDCADYDNAGRLDFFVTAYQRQNTMLFVNIGGGMFQDSGGRSGAAARTFNQVKWGCGLVDFDNDGYRDLFIVCGHLLDNVEQFDDTTSYRAHNVVLRNLGNGRFVDVSRASGVESLPAASGRGAAFDDLDNDGDIDVVILNSRGRPTVLRNMLQESGSKNHWLQVTLKGVKTNRDGVGARVTVAAGALTQIDEVHAGRGYQSHWGTRLHFGLGPHRRVDRLEVRWIGGGVEILENLPVDRHLIVTEGTGGWTSACPPASG
jgi:hypothetical protein